MKFVAQHRFIRQNGLVLCDQGGREGAAEGVLHHLGIFGGAKKHADRGAFVGLAHVAVESFEIEPQLAEVFGLEFVHFEFDGHKAVQTTVEEKKIQSEVPLTDLHGVLGADKAKIPAQLRDEAPEIA